MLQAKGSDGWFRYEPENRDARRSRSLVELVYICDVDVAKVSMIKGVASKVPVKNVISGWNCQDYVLDLLDTLEEDEIVNKNTGYQKQKTKVRAKQEGLV